MLGYGAEAESDDAAITQARALGHVTEVEIWEEERKVGIVEPPPVNNPPA
jgi:hypothetical protein